MSLETMKLLQASEVTESIYRARWEARDVADFNAHWPASILPEEPGWVDFDTRSGDLLDYAFEGHQEVDGSEVAAFLDDQLKYALEKERERV
jgi:hypothetical protein